MVFLFSINSIYDYDDAEQHLTSVTTGGITVTYSYNSDGDLLRSTDEYGITRTISYDSSSLVCSKETYDLNSEPISRFEFLNHWNGKIDVRSILPNSSATYVFDTLGNVASLTTGGSLPEIYEDLPNGKQVLIGDEVSEKLISNVTKPISFVNNFNSKSLLVCAHQ